MLGNIISAVKNAAETIDPPIVTVINKIDGDEQPAPDDIANAARELVRAKQDEGETDEIIDRCKAALLPLGPNTRVWVQGYGAIDIAQSNTISVVKVERLRELLGDRFDDLVDMKPATYKPTAKLIGMACDGDHPQRDDFLDCLAIKSSISVTYRPDK